MYVVPNTGILAKLPGKFSGVEGGRYFACEILLSNGTLLLAFYQKHPLVASPRVLASSYQITLTRKIPSTAEMRSTASLEGTEEISTTV